MDWLVRSYLDIKKNKMKKYKFPDWYLPVTVGIGIVGIILMLSGCTQVTEEVSSKKEVYELDAEKDFDYGLAYYRIYNITIVLEKGYSNLIGILMVVGNTGNTSIKLNSETYLIDDRGNQYDYSYEATSDILWYLKEHDLTFADSFENPYLSYEIQPKLVKFLIWGFEISGDSKPTKLYHKPYYNSPPLLLDITKNGDVNITEGNLKK